MLRAIFYARFHPERGPSVIHHYPDPSIIASSTSSRETLLNFSDISSYIIPPYELCNQALSICVNGCRVLGFPVSLEDARYERNRFTFNVCFVLSEQENDEVGNTRAWERVVRKTAAFFKAMEEEDGVLQAEERLEALKWVGEEGYPAQRVGVVHTLLQAIVEDLNAYGETCVRVDDLHVLNLRLAAAKPAPPKVKAWDVPLLVRPLPDPKVWTWDLALQRIYEYIDGVRHVQRVAELADVELKLVKRAVRELLYHERVVLLDIFHFQAIYALTTDFAHFVKDEDMLDECCKYIVVDPATNIFARSSQPPTTVEKQASSLHVPAKQTIITLYRSLTPGLTLHDFCLTHSTQLSNIDIRRLITFGILKGFLRRIHKYPLAIESQPTPPPHHSRGSNEDAVKEFDRAWKKAALSSGWATPPAELPLGDGIGNVSAKTTQSAEEALAEEDVKLARFLDGKHCLDEICVAMRMSEKAVMGRSGSGRFGEVVVVCK